MPHVSRVPNGSGPFGGVFSFWVWPCHLGIHRRSGAVVVPAGRVSPQPGALAELTVRSLDRWRACVGGSPHDTGPGRAGGLQPCDVTLSSNWLYCLTSAPGTTRMDETFLFSIQRFQFSSVCPRAALRAVRVRPLFAQIAWRGGAVFFGDAGGVRQTHECSSRVGRSIESDSQDGQRSDQRRRRTGGRWGCGCIWRLRFVTPRAPDGAVAERVRATGQSEDRDFETTSGVGAGVSSGGQSV